MTQKGQKIVGIKMIKNWGALLLTTGANTSTEITSAESHCHQRLAESWKHGTLIFEQLTTPFPLSLSQSFLE